MIVRSENISLISNIFSMSFTLKIKANVRVIFGVFYKSINLSIFMNDHSWILSFSASHWSMNRINEFYLIQSAGLRYHYDVKMASFQELFIISHIIIFHKVNLYQDCLTFFQTHYESNFQTSSLIIKWEQCITSLNFKYNIWFFYLFDT